MSVSQEVLLPSYWDGHSLEDECPYAFNTDLSDAEKKIRTAQWEFKKSKEKSVRDTISDAANQTLEVVETFSPESDQTIFNGLRYPEGTILRICSEDLYRTTFPDIGQLFRLLALSLFRSKEVFNVFEFASLSKWNEPEYTSRQDLGMIVASSVYPELHRMRIMHGREDFFKKSVMPDRSPYIIDERALLRVGAIEHTRSALAGTYPVIIPDYQRLSRIQKVEVLTVH